MRSRNRDTIPDRPGDTIDDKMATKRTRPETVTIYFTKPEKEGIEAAATAANLSRQDWAHATLIARAAGGMALAPELVRLVRAEAKRLKVPAEHVLSSWILAHNTKEGGE